MRQRAIRVFPLLILCLILNSVGHARYVHTPPTGIDLVSYGGNANTLVVQVVNLTPYPIQFNSASDSMQDQTDQDRKTAKQFMFAPVGIPELIPAAPAQAFVLPDLPNGQPNPDYDPDYVNTETRPYSFVLSWDDKAGYVEDNWLIWTIKSVDCLEAYVNKRYCEPTEDVDLGLFITREAATPLTADFYWNLVKTILSRTLQIVGVIVAPENPRAWSSFFLGTGSIINAAGFNSLQLTEDEGSLDADAKNKKWYIAAFPIPASDVPCYTSTPECTPTTDPGDDAVQTGWNVQGGVVQQQIVVTTHLLRGQAAQHSAKEYFCEYDQAACRGSLGSVPITMITVMTADQWLASTLPLVGEANAAGSVPTSGPVLTSGGYSGGPGQAGAELIRSILQQQGREGLLTLISILRDLPLEQREAIRELVNARRSGNPLTPRQQALVHMVAVRLRAQMK
jgi:hypothetical protein